VTVEEELAYESRVKMRQAIVAGVAGILLVGAAALQLSGPQTKVNELTIGLITVHKRFPIDVIGAVLNALGLAAVGWTLSFMFRVTKARRPELKDFIRPIAIAGAALAAIAAVLYAVLIAVKAHDFVTTGNQTYEQANALTKGAAFVTVPLFGQLGSLLLAVGFVLIALNAMRVGLLSKFMGYLGVFTGALVLFPIGSPVPVVQGFWLLALAYLLSGRWPTGVPNSWRTGVAEPWPTAQAMREQRMKRGAGAGRANAAKPAKPTAQPPAETVSAPAAARTRATTPKRKRKRRN
jgi:hypothetical protein